MWTKELLGEVATVEVGGTPSTDVSAYWGGQVPWMVSGDVHRNRVAHVDGRITELGLSASNAKIIDPPAVAVALAGQGKTRGTVALTLIPLCTNQSVALIRGKSNVLDTTYLFHDLKSRYEELRARSSGGGRGGLTKAILEALPLHLPPIEEQRRIANVLDTNDDLIAKSASVVAKLRQLKTGLMNDLLMFGLADCGTAGNNELRFNDVNDLSFDGVGASFNVPPLRAPRTHPEQFTNSHIGPLPKGWEIVRLLDHVDLPSGQVDPRQAPYRDWPLIGPDHIEGGTGRLLQISTAAEQGAISGKYVFQSGDVLYSKIRPNLRKVTLATFDGLCSADMYPMRPRPTMDSYYLLISLLGERFSRFATAVSMRSGFPKINREELAEFMIARPPIQEQQLIGQIARVHDMRIRAEETYRDKLILQKEGLMADLLTGLVRVCK
ncbi:hypothetical protein CCAX7_25900 [Capsulimonas corticalis]|uniref:Uncharacterized protein n=1 Tax=Capsulimonas corticalis TaxID=2219043 RepID=A0A402CVV8_9BACT|nr:restriction endonuclease subunit S [Capsulimonas corticalis]BDI30539.1 hypothetical protein CCAX7_25900 [Capsulimonas corticalis]